MIIYFLSICVVIAVPHHKQVGQSLQPKNIEFIEQSIFGQAMLRMAQLNSKLQGPLEDLISTIKAFEDQLQQRMAVEDQSFKLVESAYQTKMNFFTTSANQIQVLINKEKQYMDTLNNDDSKLLDLKDSRLQNQNRVQIEIAIRKQHNQAYTLQITEIQNGIESIDGGLVAIEKIIPYAQTLSLMELEEAQFTRDQRKDLLKRLRRISINGTEVLSQVINENESFSQRKLIRSLIDTLNSLRQSLVQTQIEAIANEQQEKQMSDDRLVILKSELQSFDQRYGVAVQEMDTQSSQRRESQGIVELYNKDQEQITKRVELEKENYILNKQSHDQLCSLIVVELNQILKSIDILSDQEVQDYLLKQIVI